MMKIVGVCEVFWLSSQIENTQSVREVYSFYISLYRIHKYDNDDI